MKIIDIQQSASFTALKFSKLDTLAKARRFLHTKRSGFSIFASILLIHPAVGASCPEMRPPPEIQVQLQSILDDGRPSESKYPDFAALGETGERVADYVDLFTQIDPEKPFDPKAYLEETTDLINTVLNKYILALAKLDVNDRIERRLFRSSFNKFDLFNKVHCVFPSNDVVMLLTDHNYLNTEEQNIYTDLKIANTLRNLVLESTDEDFSNSYIYFITRTKGFIFSKELSFWEDREGSLCSEISKRECISKIEQIISRENSVPQIDSSKQTTDWHFENFFCNLVIVEENNNLIKLNACN